MTGGLAYLAIQRQKGKGWSKMNKEMEEMNVTEDMEALGLLVGENEVFEKAEDTDWEVERELVALLRTSRSQ